MKFTETPLKGAYLIDLEKRGDERGFFARSGQPLKQDWLIEMAKRLARHVPIKMGILMGIAAVIRPRTRRWKKSREAIASYVDEQNRRHRAALNLGAKPTRASSEATTGAGRT